MLEHGEHIEELGSGVKVLVSRRCAFGMDAVALASFSFPPSGVRAADLGTGCGIIPLLWCTSTAFLWVDAVEIDSEAARAARRSVALSALEGVVHVIEDDYLTCPLLPAESYDVVVCNPPYRKLGSGGLSLGSYGKTAKHETAATLEQIVSRAAGLLKNGGRLFLCHRPERMPELFGLLRGQCLEPKRMRLIQHDASASPSLLLLESRKNTRPGLRVDPTLLVESDEMQAIYDGFRPKRQI